MSPITFFFFSEYATDHHDNRDHKGGLLSFRNLQRWLHLLLFLSGLWSSTTKMGTLFSRCACALSLSPSPFLLISVLPQVSNVLYRLHKSILTSRLELFGGMFQLADHQSKLDEGIEDSHPIQLENGVTVREDFEALLKHIYGP